MPSQHRPRRHRREGRGFLSQTGDPQTGNVSACSPLKSSRGICPCITVLVSLSSCRHLDVASLPLRNHPAWQDKCFVVATCCVAIAGLTLIAFTMQSCCTSSKGP